MARSYYRKPPYWIELVLQSLQNIWYDTGLCPFTSRILTFAGERSDHTSELKSWEFNKLRCVVIFLFQKND
jgi:hypothetical protein